MSNGAVVPLVEHFFRHEAGRLVSTLTRLFSLSNIDRAEDVVQASLMEALNVWRTRGIPDQPQAWIRRVAKNKLLDLLRHDRIELNHASFLSKPEAIEDSFRDHQIEDSQLRMIFLCCDPRLTDGDRIALTLKTLCGFGHEEIARALLSTHDAIKKRIQRAKAFLVEQEVSFDLSLSEWESRTHDVHRVLYLLFNEGYLSTQDDCAIRNDLCEEAIRLTQLVADHPQFGRPSSDALLALMLFHSARAVARLDELGRIVLLGDQDRSVWNHAMIDQGCERLDRSARGTVISRYHLEAGIAMMHCRAKSLQETPWPNIIQLYDALLTACPTPIYELNRAIAIGEHSGPAEAIRVIVESNLPARHEHYLVQATLGELYARMGRIENAIDAWQSAIRLNPSPREQELIQRKMQSAIQQNG